MTDSGQEIIEQITAIRATNNDLWMTILRIALAAAPMATKQVLRQIKDNDQKISSLLGRLAI